MARLETQINQIYLTHPETKKASLVLYEEPLTNSLNLFILAELNNLQRKSEAADLKKISEIILQSFRSNKKLPAETLFETSLSQINQNLADLAHEGRKSWVGKFSCLILIKAADNNIYAANNGQTAVWLKRKSELMEILASEKRGIHPLKTFVNFTQGKLTDNDSLILTTSNIFNYVSFELFSKLLDQNPLDRACGEISKILQDSIEAEQAYCAFFLHFSKKPLEEPIVQDLPVSEIYAPLPEEITELPQRKFALKIPKLGTFIPAINLAAIPSVNWDKLLGMFKKFEWKFFQNLSRAGKFFFLSFSVFLILFFINLGFYAFKLKSTEEQKKIDNLVIQINNDIASTQSALIYKNNDEALKQLSITENDLAELKKLSPQKALELTPKVEQVKVQINKINTVNDLKIHLELKHHPTFLSPAPSGLLFANQDSNSLSLFSNNTLTDYFLLNSLKSSITGISYFQPSGVVVSISNEIYRVDQNLKQFEPIVSISGADLIQVKSYNNALYALNRNGQVVKINNKYQTQTAVSGEFAAARDFGVDKDIYILYPDHLIKYVSGQPQAFKMPDMSEALSNASKILVAANLYILEATKKRVIIMTKNGVLINQIYFPTSDSPTDFYVDEPSRSIYLLDDNKLYKITF